MQINSNLLWLSKRQYYVNDIVFALSEFWICVKEHESNIFGNDQLEGYWQVYHAK
jgi:hypothetical protein